MTDELMKALECRMPTDTVCVDAYNLINRQQAEIEGLKEDFDFNIKLNGLLQEQRDGRDELIIELDEQIDKLNRALQTAKTEAIKEFADELFTKFAGHSDYHGDTILGIIECMAEGKETNKAITLNKDKIKSEAIEEFAEKFKEKAGSIVASCQGYEIYETKQYQISAISFDNLVKEMVGDSDA